MSKDASNSKDVFSVEEAIAEIPSVEDGDDSIPPEERE